MPDIPNALIAVPALEFQKPTIMWMDEENLAALQDKMFLNIFREDNELAVLLLEDTGCRDLRPGIYSWFGEVVAERDEEGCYSPVFKGYLHVSKFTELLGAKILLMAPSLEDVEEMAIEAMRMLFPRQTRSKPKQHVIHPVQAALMGLEEEDNV